MAHASFNSYERGLWAELVARDFLKKQGLKLLEQNFHGPGGEIDLIMMDGNTIVFTEVRYRSSNRYLHAVESIDSRKCARIIKTARNYLQKNHNIRDNPCRFDVITITGDTGSPEIGWIKDAFQA